jgi:hypothetical protein
MSSEPEWHNCGEGPGMNTERSMTRTPASFIAPALRRPARRGCKQLGIAIPFALSETLVIDQVPTMRHNHARAPPVSTDLECGGGAVLTLQRPPETATSTPTARMRSAN